MKNNNFKQPRPQRKPRFLREIYIVSFALYSNLAIDTLRSFINEKKPVDFLENLIKKQIPDSEELSKCASILKANYPFIRSIIQPDTSNEDVVKTFLVWAKQMADIRNMYSHAYHTSKLFNKDLCGELLRLYKIGIENCHLKKNDKFPYSYLPKEQVKDDDTLYGIYGIKKDGSCFLTYTGIVFYTSLFLKNPDVNDFISDLCGNAIDRDPSLKRKREKFKKENGKGVEYPKELQVKQKDFLYAPDVYTRFAIKGHTTAISTHHFDKKIRFFELMEYLKQCPLERINCLKKDGSKSDDFNFSVKGVKLSDSNEEFKLREKNRFLSLSLDYWNDFIIKQMPKNFTWEWARHASAAQKQDNKEQKGYDKLCFHERIIWEEPAGEAQYNEEGDRMTFPYFIEGNNVFFRLKRQNSDEYYVGKMSSAALCELLQLYFLSEDKHRFMSHAFNETYDYISKYLQCTDEFRASNNNWATPIKFEKSELLGIVENAKFNPLLKVDENLENIFGYMLHAPADGNVLKTKIENRINYLTSYYKDISEKATMHQKNIEIVRAWFSVLNYGATSNWAHSIDVDGKTGIINQYRMITYYLSRLEENNPKVNNDFFAFLHQSGVEALLRNSKWSYLLNSDGTLNGYFQKAMQYRLSVLNDYYEKVKQFNPAEWKPMEELRWLQIRTPQTAAAYPKHSEIPIKKKIADFGAKPVNVSQGVYFANRAVSLPYKFYSRVLNKTEYPEVRVTLFEQFYQLDNERSYRSNNIKRLKQIKLQDTVIAAMVSDYAGLIGLSQNVKIQLSDDSYETHPFITDYEINDGNTTITVGIKYYYRYMKLSRYRYSVTFIRYILEAMLKHGLIKSGDTLPFNKMITKPDDKGDTHFVKDENIKLSLLDIIYDYQKQREKFIDKILKLDKKVGKMYQEKNKNAVDYISFGKLSTYMKECGVDNTEIIKEYRNAALHGSIYIDGVVRNAKDFALSFFGNGILEIENALKFLKRVKSQHKVVLHKP